MCKTYEGNWKHTRWRLGFRSVAIWDSWCRLRILYFAQTKSRSKGHYQSLRWKVGGIDQTSWAPQQQEQVVKECATREVPSAWAYVSRADKQKQYSKRSKREHFRVKWQFLLLADIAARREFLMLSFIWMILPRPPRLMSELCSPSWWNQRARSHIGWCLPFPTETTAHINDLSLTKIWNELWKGRKDHVFILASACTYERFYLAISFGRTRM